MSRQIPRGIVGSGESEPSWYPLSHEYRDGLNYYRVKAESDAKIQLVCVWSVYAHNFSR